MNISKNIPLPSNLYTNQVSIHVFIIFIPLLSFSQVILSGLYGNNHTQQDQLLQLKYQQVYVVTTSRFVVMQLITFVNPFISKWSKINHHQMA